MKILGDDDRQETVLQRIVFEDVGEAGCDDRLDAKRKERPCLLYTSDAADD
jgi:hypothetical protein